MFVVKFESPMTSNEKNVDIIQGSQNEKDSEYV